MLTNETSSIKNEASTLNNKTSSLKNEAFNLNYKSPLLFTKH